MNPKNLTNLRSFHTEASAVLVDSDLFVLILALAIDINFAS